MKKLFHHDRNIDESRFLHANVIILCLTALLLVRLWYVQIYRGDYYKRISENNRIQYIEIPAPRGIIYDRLGEVILGNRPYFDLVFVPQFATDKEKSFEILSRLLHVPTEIFEKRLWQSRGIPDYIPRTLKRNLTLHEVSTVQSNRVFLPGIDISIAPRRDYKVETPSHMVGYLGEINREQLSRKRKEQDASHEYRAGDLIGKQGLESRWEDYLRGKRGSQLVQVDAFGRRVQSRDREPYELTTVPATPGNDLILTLDMKLQTVVREAFQGKNGAVVVLDPRNGEILAMTSEPGYDPNIYQSVLSPEKYRSLLANPFKPFLDKTTGGSFIPGSVYKAVVAIAALEENVINPQTSFYCPGYYTLGGQTFHCHDRAGHGQTNLRKALMKSCDVYFYNIGVEMGVDKIAKYAQMFGLGQKLGVQLNMEVPGLVPTTAWKKLTYRVPWTTGETPSIAIGQGANQMTPMQMANLYATIGNGGKLWRPFLVKKVINHLGETVLVQDSELIKTIADISPKTFELVKEGLQAVVMDKDGTGKAAAVPEVTVAGKTGSVQVVSLEKNRNSIDVSAMWREHAMFAAFSPVDHPEIAVAVVSEHDKEGGGGKSAAPVAGKIIEAFWQFKKERADRTISLRK